MKFADVATTGVTVQRGPPNSAGVIIDAVRPAKIAADAGLGGPADAGAAYFMKSPPVQHPDDEARALVEAFVAEHAPE